MDKRITLPLLVLGTLRLALAYDNCLCVYDIDRTLTGAQACFSTCMMTDFRHTVRLRSPPLG